MIEKAWSWAQTHGRVRTNEIHGEQEIQVVVDEKFEMSKLDIEENERSGTITVEEGLHACMHVLIACFFENWSWP